MREMSGAVVAARVSGFVALGGGLVAAVFNVLLTQVYGRTYTIGTRSRVCRRQSKHHLSTLDEDHA